LQECGLPVSLLLRFKEKIRFLKCSIVGPDLAAMILTALVFDSKTLIEANCDFGLMLLIGKR
jgi:hypothetical protein